MEKINVEAVCKAYNTARDKNAGKKMSNQQVINILKEQGISQTLAIKIVANQTLLNKSKRENMGRGRHVAYAFPYNPIHITWFKNWIYPQKKEEAKKDIPFEQECVDYLKEKGYALKKCIGFDEDAFKKDYPQLYEKYLIYENI